MTKTPAWFLWLCYGAVTLALLVPLFGIDHPQAIDLANHLARQYARDALPEMYDFRWMLFPYMGFDALSALLMKFVPVYDAGRIIMGIIFVLWVAAPACLYRALWGEWSLWPLLAALVVFNANIAWGFGAYSLMSACAVLLLAGWIVTEDRDSPKKIALFGVLAFLLYIGHLTAFAIFALLIGTYEISKLHEQKKLNLKNLIRRGLLLAPLWLPAALHFIYISMKYPPAHKVVTSDFGLQDRVLMLGSPFMNGLVTRGDVTMTDVSMASMLFMAGVFVFLLLRNGIQFKKTMALTLLLLAALALVMPPKLLGISFIHYRLPFLVIALLVSSTRMTSAHARIIAACFIALLAVRVMDVSAIWKQYDSEVKELAVDSKMLRAGDRVLVVNTAYEKAFTEHYHTASFLSIEHQAFVPNTFVLMQYFTAKGDYARLTHPTATHPMDAQLLAIARAGKDKRLQQPVNAYFRTWWKDFDYVIAYEIPKTKPLLPALLKPVAHGSYFTIYKVRGRK